MSKKRKSDADATEAVDKKKKKIGKDDSKAATPDKKQKKKEPGKGKKKVTPVVVEKKAPKRPKRKGGKKKAKDPEHVHETAGQGKALKYLEAWDRGDGEWKFEKCRQIWLLENCYDARKVPDENFDTLLKYVASIKGRMREMALGNSSSNVHIGGGTQTRFNIFAPESAQKKVEEDDAWEAEIAAGKSEADLILEKKRPRQDKKVLQRARDIAEMLKPDDA